MRKYSFDSCLSNGQLAALLLLAKLLFFLVLLFWVKQGGLSFTATLHNWDVSRYVMLATEGYLPGNADRNVYFPLFPTLMAFLYRVSGLPPVWAGLLLANACSLWGFAIFYRWVEKQKSSRLANLSLLFLLTQPTAVFFALPYTESLFFLLVILYLREYSRGIFLLSLMAFLLPLTRSVGLLLLAPLCFDCARSYLRDRSVPKQLYLVLLFLLLGSFTYFFCMWHFTGNALSGMESQKLFVFQASLFRFFEPLEFLKAFFSIGPWFAYFDSALDRVYAVAFFFTLWRLARKQSDEFFTALTLGLVSLVSLRFAAFSRYALVVPQLFSECAEFMDRGPVRRFLFLVILLLGLATQILVIRRFCHGEWVA
jgi:hypothetical protein